MGQEVVMGAMLQCTMGLAPSSLVVIPKSRVTAGGPPAANVLDHLPMVNIPPFGMCTTPSNPTVAAATAAALGVLTPMPCVPVTTAPWVPGSPTVQVGGMPALSATSKAICAFGGSISVAVPGQFTVQVP